MAAVTAAMVKELRERTGLGMMECKKALVAAEGNIDAAIEELRKSSGMKAAKKAGRTAAEGAVEVKVSDDGKLAVMVEVNSETDFVARDTNFKGFVKTVLETAFASKTSDVAALMATEVEGATLEQKREALVQKIGENIGVRRIELLEAQDGVIGAYVHGNSKIASLVKLTGGNAELGRDLAMHVTAENPQFVSPEVVPEDVINKEKDIFEAQAQGSGKPAEIIEKMTAGRIKKFLAEISLVEQQFVKDPEVTVSALVKKEGATIDRFTRFEVGEGIQKEEVDFAKEVMEQVKGAQ